MDELIDAYGEDFVSDLKGTIAERREQRNSLTDEDRIGIADKAINQGAFAEGDPKFQYTNDNGITHDVLLMESPNPESKPWYSMANKLDSGAVTLPLLYLGEFMSCLFNDPDIPKEMEEGEWYIVAGRMTQWEDQQGNMHDQVSPVRGVLTHDEAVKLAEKYLDESDINESEPEPSDEVNEEPAGEEEPPDKSEVQDDDQQSEEALGFGSGDDEEEEDDGTPDIDYGDVSEVVEALADSEPTVWELEKGDGRLDKLGAVVCQRIGYLNHENAEHIIAVKELCLQRIDEESESEEDDEEAALFG